MKRKYSTLKTLMPVWKVTFILGLVALAYGLIFIDLPVLIFSVIFLYINGSVIFKYSAWFDK